MLNASTIVEILEWFKPLWSPHMSLVLPDRVNELSVAQTRWTADNIAREYIIPIHHEDCCSPHWTISFLDVQTRMIHFYDPLRDPKVWHDARERLMRLLEMNFGYNDKYGARKAEFETPSVFSSTCWSFEPMVSLTWYKFVLNIAHTSAIDRQSHSRQRLRLRPIMLYSGYQEDLSD